MGAKAGQSLHRCTGVVEGCLGPQALGQHVFDASQLEHRADRATRNHTGTGSGRADEHTGSAVAAIAEGGDGAVAGEGHLDQVLLAIGHALADGTDHIASLADTHAHLALLVADDNDGPEAHLLTALDGLGDAADLDHPLLPLGVALLAATVVAPTATATAAVVATPALTAATAALLLAFGRCRNIRCGWNDVGLNLIVGFGHGESRDQN